MPRFMPIVMTVTLGVLLAAYAGACGRQNPVVHRSPVARPTQRPVVKWTMLWTKVGTLPKTLNDHPPVWTKGKPFHLPYGLVRFHVTLPPSRYGLGGLSLVGLAPYYARAQALGSVGGSEVHMADGSWVGNYLVNRPIVAGMYRVDLTGSGKFKLTVYVRKP